MKDKNKIKNFSECVGIIVISVIIGIIILFIMTLILHFFNLPIWLLPIIILLSLFYILWKLC